MAIPDRNSEVQAVLDSRRTFFVTTRTYSGRRVFQVDRHAELFIDVLRSNARRFQIHDFVVMPDHVHLLVSVDGELSIEKAVQYIKGGFSFRVKRELGYSGEVWQRGFSEVRVNDEESLRKHREYIAQNPVRAGLAMPYPWCFEVLKKKKAQGLKPGSFRPVTARLKSCPDTKRRG
jgi:putative transposase